MITQTLSPRRAARLSRPRRSEPYLRALAIMGVLDCYVTDTGRISFAPRAIKEQLPAYEAARKAAAGAPDAAER